jgi:hypothetical protein
MNILSFFKALGEKIHSALLAVFGQSALDSVEAQIKVILEDDVRVIFIDAITAAQALTTGTGQDKRNAAFNQISTDVQAKGISLGTSAINMGIELVVNLLKAKGGAGFAAA